MQEQISHNSIEQAEPSKAAVAEAGRPLSRSFYTGVVLLVLSIPLTILGGAGAVFGAVASGWLMKIGLWSYGIAWVLFLAGLALSGREGYRLAKGWLKGLWKRFRKRRDSSGFTLLELLIAAAITAIILVILGSVFAGSLRSMGEIRDTTAQYGDLERILMLIAEDLNGTFVTTPPNPRYGFEITSDELEGRPADRLGFTTATQGLVEPDRGMVEVSYHLDEGHLYRREDVTLDGTFDDDEGTELELGQDLLAFNCTCLGRSAGEGLSSEDWLEDWPLGKKGLPCVVRIELTALVGEEEKSLSTAVALPLGE